MVLPYLPYHIRMYACSHVPVTACTHVRMYACTNVRMYACTHVRMYACTHVRMYACMYACEIMYACTHLCMYVCTHARMYECTPVPDYDDNASLQEDLNRITEWSLLWELPFNEDKCKCMHIGEEKNKHSYHMKDYALQNVKEEKDLEILIDDKLKFHTHTSSVIKNANSILGLIKRSFSVLDENTLPRLYASMVRLHLEYGNVIWGPHNKGDIKAIEKVQKRATKIVPSLKNLTYVRRLETLKLPSLVYRRKMGDMIMWFKMMSKQVNVDTKTYFTMNNFKTKGHEYKNLKTKRASK